MLVKGEELKAMLKRYVLSARQITTWFVALVADFQTSGPHVETAPARLPNCVFAPQTTANLVDNDRS